MNPQDIKILLVEDAAVMRKIEMKALQNIGIQSVIEAVDGNDAISKLQANSNINLIISDWNMPNKDGFELLVWVRSSDKFKNIPFLMATGQGDKKQEQKAVDAGVSSFVAKPFNNEELKNKIDEAFGLKKKDDKANSEEIGPRASKSGKALLRVAHIQITDHLVLGVLKHLIEKGELTPKHFELETKCMPGWNPVAESLEKGIVDAACVLAPIAMDLFSVGVAIKLILFAHRSGSILVRSKHGEYNEPFLNFFKNKTFYIPHKMSVHHMLAHMFFNKIGVKASMSSEKKDVNLEVVAPIKMPEFLKENQNSCGFMVAEPLGTKAIAAGIAELQFLSGEFWERHPCCVVAMREDFIEHYKDAVYEFVDMLVQAGSFIEKKVDTAAEIAVAFLDPDKTLGLKVPILKNVLTEGQGIKTGDLFPVIDDLNKMQQYMYYKMGIGSLINLEKFVDSRFAQAAYKSKDIIRKPSNLHDSVSFVTNLLHKSALGDKNQKSKSMLNKEGKYLTFSLDNQEYGIDILKIKEIIAMMPIRSVPHSPPFVKGVINLRNEVIQVIDLRTKFEMEGVNYTDRSCIIILELEVKNGTMHMGIAVDSVSEVLVIKSSDIEEPPRFGANIKTDHVLAMATVGKGIKILLDIDNVMDCKNIEL